MSTPDSTHKKSPDLEVKDAQLIFNSVWDGLEAERGRENMRFPKEIILLGGAPGSGKGTNTAYICKVRDITAPPIVVSSLLDTPAMEALKAGGNMVGDREVVDILFRGMLDPIYREGVVLDGFPRTTVQVECIKMLYDKMVSLRRAYQDTPLKVHFKQPIYHIMVLFVDEAESIARQLKRGREVIAHNEEVKRTGTGELLEERPTDTNEDLARNRYRTFKEKTYDALVSLKQIFHYHFINAQLPLEEVQQKILKELEYQSSLELDPRTYDVLRNLPEAAQIVKHARRDLVYRIDRYRLEHPNLFDEVVTFIEEKIIPIVKPHAISGMAHINSEDDLLEDPLALAMLIDVFSERGFFASVDIHRVEVPDHFDVETGHISCREKRVFRIAIRFKGSEIRRG
ncbi:adenylate kinase [Oceaniferula spumae]|uniref:Adenylate kinase n=1 Tax=Oceaniferula spumae TaxID=2979115 RepID=A0AAT9FME7_9BACT